MSDFSLLDNSTLPSLSNLKKDEGEQVLLCIDVASDVFLILISSMNIPPVNTVPVNLYCTLLNPSGISKRYLIQVDVVSLTVAHFCQLLSSFLIYTFSSGIAPYG